MNLILFLGAGISKASGYPDAVDLTNIVLDSDTHKTETNFLKALKDFDDKARTIGGTIDTIKEHIVGEIYRKSTSYEDLYYLCDEIASFDWGLHNNAMVPAFVESFVEKLIPRSSLNQVGRKAHAAKAYINKTIVENLPPVTQIKGLDLIVELAIHPKVTSLNIVTLNHDLLVEKLLANNAIEFADGFGNSDGEVRWFDPNTYLTDVKVKLFKLHGSVDWYSFSNREYNPIGRTGSSISENKKNAKGEDLELEIKTPQVLSGLNKIHFYGYGIYTDIHYYFHKILYENTIMVMSGYGWGDDSINNRLMTWLDKKKENKLILLHRDPEFLKSRSLIIDRDYSNWKEGGKLRIIRKWLSETTVDQLMELC